ncbi:MAG: hypothetical protein CMJ49_08235 [Planctomycetaceae bacterium]|nr:hypothetical protein [Planctomycetaceae bacterium]
MIRPRFLSPISQWPNPGTHQPAIAGPAFQTHGRSADSRLADADTGVSQVRRWHGVAARRGVWFNAAPNGGQNMIDTRIDV